MSTITSTSTNTYDVQVGQVWKDNDPRAKERLLQIDEAGETHARASVVVVRKGGFDKAPGRSVRIRLDRFRPTSTGYVRVP